MLTGVCGGIADYFNLDPTLVRLVFIAVALFVVNLETVMVVYCILWVVMPAQPKEKAKRKNGEFSESLGA
ncbi:MAG: PspC domain-containing protein [Chloroflexi bacterium]|nr:PspC domain-containing protein [Chloroflexota bacterium]